MAEPQTRTPRWSWLTTLTAKLATLTAWVAARWLTILASLLVAIVTVAAFAVSFRVLSDLAARSGIPDDVAWLWPVIVDGTIVAAMLVLFAVRGTKGLAAWFPRITLVLFILISIAGNAMHALLLPDAAEMRALVGLGEMAAAWIGIAVCAVPPLGLALTAEMLVLLLHMMRDQGATADDGVAADEGRPARHVRLWRGRGQRRGRVLAELQIASQVVTSAASHDDAPLADAAPATPSPSHADQAEPARALTTSIADKRTAPSHAAEPVASHVETATASVATASVAAATATATDEEAARATDAMPIAREDGSHVADETADDDATPSALPVAEPVAPATPPARLHAVEPLPADAAAIPADKAGQIAWIVARAEDGDDTTWPTLAALLRDAGHALSDRTVQARLTEARKQAPDAFAA